MLLIDCSKDINTITFITTKGKIEVKLFKNSNPVTVGNFLKNIEKGIYNNKRFYKITNFPNNKIIHAGAMSSNELQGELNLERGNIDRTIPLEISIKNSNEPIYNSQINDPTKLKELRFLFEKGSLAMKKVDHKSSSSTEFFFLTNKSSAFDGRYSIFGKVVKGFNTLSRIEKGDLIIKINPKNLNL